MNYSVFREKIFQIRKLYNDIYTDEIKKQKFYQSVNNEGLTEEEIAVKDLAIKIIGEINWLELHENWMQEQVDDYLTIIKNHIKTIQEKINLIMEDINK